MFTRIIRDEQQYLKGWNVGETELLLLYISPWMHHMNNNQKYGEKTWRQLHKDTASNIE